MSHFPAVNYSGTSPSFRGPSPVSPSNQQRQFTKKQLVSLILNEISERDDSPLKKGSVGYPWIEVLLNDPSTSITYIDAAITIYFSEFSPNYNLGSQTFNECFSTCLNYKVTRGKLGINYEIKYDRDQSDAILKRRSHIPTVATPSPTGTTASPTPLPAMPQTTSTFSQPATSTALPYPQYPSPSRHPTMPQTQLVQANDTSQTRQKIGANVSSSSDAHLFIARCLAVFSGLSQIDQEILITAAENNTLSFSINQRPEHPNRFHITISKGTTYDKNKHKVKKIILKLTETIQHHKPTKHKLPLIINAHPSAMAMNFGKDGNHTYMTRLASFFN